MHELSPSDIPSQWKFPEKGVSGLKPVQVDTDSRFLAFTLPDNPNIILDHYKGEYYDYFFSSNNNRVDCRKHSSFDTNISLEGDIGYFLRFHDSTSPPFGSMEITFYHPPIRAGYVEFEVGNGKKGLFEKLQAFALDEFGVDENGEVIFSPYIIIQLKSDAEGFKSEDWELNPITNLNGFFKSPAGHHKALCIDRNGRENFQVRYSNEENEEIFELDWGVKDDYLIVAQKHFPTKISKVIQAPLRPDMEKINEVIFSSPPYSKISCSNLGRVKVLDVPWRKIDRILNAKLSYKMKGKINHYLDEELE